MGALLTRGMGKDDSFVWCLAGCDPHGLTYGCLLAGSGGLHRQHLWVDELAVSMSEELVGSGGQNCTSRWTSTTTVLSTEAWRGPRRLGAGVPRAGPLSTRLPPCPQASGDGFVTTSQIWHRWSRPLSWNKASCGRRRQRAQWRRRAPLDGPDGAWLVEACGLKSQGSFFFFFFCPLVLLFLAVWRAGQQTV